MTKESRHSKMLSIIFLVFTIFCLNSVSLSVSAVQLSYADHCASFVPESTEKINVGSHFVHLIHTGYYNSSGASDILHIHSPHDQIKYTVQFQCWDIRETDVQGLFKVEGTLQFEVTHTIHLQSLPEQIVPGSVTFRLNGFWSESSGKLCMVGSGSSYSKQGNPLVVLKLYNLMNSTSVTSLVSGTIESVTISKKGPDYSGPISILLFPRINYEYNTLVSSESDDSYSDESEETTKSLEIEIFCSLLSTVILNRDFKLEYLSNCKSAKNCTPVAMADVPRVVSLKDIDCSEDKRRLRLLIEFADIRKNWNDWNSRPFSPSTTLLGEGSWDVKNNQLRVVACQLLNSETSLNNTHVGDCSTRLSLRFPATGTIGNTGSIVGNIWSTKSATVFGYFEKITFPSPDNDFGKCLVPGQTYEYTKMDKVTKLCLRKSTASEKASSYPYPPSQAMSFIMQAKNAKGQVASSNWVLFSVGNEFYQNDMCGCSSEDAVSPVSEYSVAPPSSSSNHSNFFNISYKTTLHLQSNPMFGKRTDIYEMHISAEGIYDATDGSLCMLGCSRLRSDSQEAIYEDCEMLVNFQLPPKNAKGPPLVTGSIESTRKKTDPLYFERLDTFTVANDEGFEFIQRMDRKVVLAFISSTLACIFSALQLFHVKKHPDVLPSISMLMLLILTLGYMLPLVLNIEAIFTQRKNRHIVMLGSGRLLEVYEIIIRVTTLLTFLIQSYLLKLTWSATSANGTQKNLRGMEKKALRVALRVYVVGALGALLLHRQNLRQMDNGYVPTQFEHPILDAMISYGGLVLDGFLFPQILLNMVCKSKAKALSVWYYIGTTLVQALPHAYELYRVHCSTDDQLDQNYYFSPITVEDFYTTIWNVIITFGGILFAGMIYSQQRFGDSCIAPKQLRELGVYEKVPTDHE